MSDGTNSDKIEIFLSDDQKIKAVGELLTNNSSRTILQLLFEEELTANEISQKSQISLQLVKYHLNKMQQVGMVRISRVGKNIKSHDMKYYKATKFAIVILPSKVSERAKESKALIRSFKTIYKFAGIGVAAVAGLFAMSFLQEQSRMPAPGSDSKDMVETPHKRTASIEPTENPQIKEANSESPTTTADSQNPTDAKSHSPAHTEGEAHSLGGVKDPRDTSSLEEVLEIQMRRKEAVEASPAAGSGTPYMDGGDVLITIIIIAVILGVPAAYFFFRTRRHSKLEKIKE